MPEPTASLQCGRDAGGMDPAGLTGFGDDGGRLIQGPSDADDVEDRVCSGTARWDDVREAVGPVDITVDDESGTPTHPAGVGDGDVDEAIRSGFDEAELFSRGVVAPRGVRAGVQESGDEAFVVPDRPGVGGIDTRVEGLPTVVAGLLPDAVTRPARGEQLDPRHDPGLTPDHHLDPLVGELPAPPPLHPPQHEPNAVPLQNALWITASR
ncbi:hypothetical protein ACIA49_16635 [Kribbella sp. NPDC051587]|uniref:hypothetical protein n=1 Tax=Kribbella sp. NPDC051587 TaxID=3364119 RepID=UPI00378D6DA1